jgi:hypothetical protein
VQFALTVPTISDRIAQTVVKRYLEPLVEPVFHRDSYGYRPGRSAHQALDATRQRCWEYEWVLDLDIKNFFGSIDWDLMIRAVRHHTDCAWALLYIERWLKAPVHMPDGRIAQEVELTERIAGLPVGLLAVHDFGLFRMQIQLAFGQPPLQSLPELACLRFARRTRSVRQLRQTQVMTVQCSTATTQLLPHRLCSPVADRWQEAYRQLTHPIPDTSRSERLCLAGFSITVDFIGPHWARCSLRLMPLWSVGLNGNTNTFAATRCALPHGLKDIRSRQPSLFAHWAMETTVGR